MTAGQDAPAGPDNLALAAYEALARTRKLGSHRATTFRCPNRDRCLLLDVLRTPKGLLIYLPAYKLSPQRNQTRSSAAGRANHTSDGDRHWKASATWLTMDWRYQLQCDHVTVVVTTAEVRDAVESGHEVVVVT